MALDDKIPFDRDGNTLVDLSVRAAAAVPGWAPEHGPPPILAGIGEGEEPRKFTDNFRIGRDKECELQVVAEGVSRNHCEVFWANGSWRVLLEHRDRFPRETYDYVLKVFSAAVIGENPRLYGFDFEPPLEGAVERATE
jgi:hypothetical protein